ncbi:hypothetical protein L211DRAFT_870963 [Terfezia boudieri ATCC MYA-4762]|uniref:Uncharacterized protein n=1 Tax=Terfezia boudieri ATCC MYA-4762 TaxID=1051890 RepID=A0A3N4LEL9_9PEZI|nr:hypothetical protein L211DRAFT_870963 [Terfezia boudieri ATCC MYA-4762]
MLSKTAADKPSTTKRRHIPCGLESPPSTPRFAEHRHLCASPLVKAHTTLHPPLPSPPSSVCGNIVDPNQEITKHMLQGSENSITLSNVSPRCYRRLAERGVRLRHTYFTPIDTLLLRPMITPVHGLVQSFFGSVQADMRSTGFLDESEYGLIDTSIHSVQLPHIGDTVLSSGETIHTALAGSKEADAVISTYELDAAGMPVASRTFPNIVVEVGLSESYTDLVRDARHWLEQTRGKVRVVILVKIYEEPQYSQLRQRRQPPTPTPDLADQGEYSDVSSGSSYEQQETHFRSSEKLCNQYVGNLSGFVEVWRYSHRQGGMYQDGPRMDLLPHLSSSRTLTISRKDLDLPKRERRNHLRVDLAPLATIIEHLGKYKLAYWRWQQRRPMRRQRRGRQMVQIDTEAHELESSEYPTDEGEHDSPMDKPSEVLVVRPVN